LERRALDRAPIGRIGTGSARIHSAQERHPWQEAGPVENKNCNGSSEESYVLAGLGLMLIVATNLLDVPRPERQLPVALPMIRLEACQIELTPLSNSADFVGSVEYRATVNAEGALSRLTFIRQVGDPPATISMRRLVRLDQFEACVRRWRFGTGGEYRLTLQGGTMSDEWRIRIDRNGKSLRLIVPRRK